MNYGDPKCRVCHGKGGWRDGFGWRRCHCTRPTAETKRAMKRAREVAGFPRQMTIDEMIALGSSGHSEASR